MYGYEILFMPVGNESKSGDAIALRVGNLFGRREEQTVILIDGGFQETGEYVVEKIPAFFRTKTIDFVVSTHPDQDHIGGLTTVLDELDVRSLLMHQPWKFLPQSKLPDAVDSAVALYKKAKEKGIPILGQPFANEWAENIKGGHMRVVGPSRNYYTQLLPEFDSDGKPADVRSGIMAKAAKIVDEAKNWVLETMDKDSIRDDVDTSATNNSSVMLEIMVDGKRILFTGDAGISALAEAAAFMGCSPGENLAVIQIPHHGSRHNVGPIVLNQIVGSIGDQKNPPIDAVVSCALDGESQKHPNKRVLNAFTRRGVRCYKTQDKNIGQKDGCVVYHNAPNRGLAPITQCPFYSTVEQEDD